VLDGHGTGLNVTQVKLLQSTLNQAMDRLLLSRTVVPGDTLVERYRVVRGDILSSLGNRYKVPYWLIKRINRIERDRDLLADSRIKIPRGPFHAVIGKADYRMDLYCVDPGGKRVFVCSYPVGLGAENSTPIGRWVIRRGKMVDPDWRNPVTGRYYPANSKENPIGEHWIPLRGVDAKTRSLEGYGIHGTIEPDSIGQQNSMGCVRLLPADVERIYHMLTVFHSQVEIRP
jgi:LysM repeat protein